MQRELSGAENLKFPLNLAPHTDDVVSLVIHPHMIHQSPSTVNGRILAF